MGLTREVKVYPLAFDHADARMTVEDIREAMRQYEKEKGYPPAELYLNPDKKFRERLGTLPDDIQIIDQGGVMAWECWLAGEKKPAPVLTPPDSLQDLKSGGQKRRDGKLLVPLNYETIIQLDDALQLNSDGDVSIIRGKGRPRKRGKGLSRTTLWRRRREILKKQERMI